MSGKLILYCSRSSDLKFKFSDSSDGPVGSDSSNYSDGSEIQKFSWFRMVKRSHIRLFRGSEMSLKMPEKPEELDWFEEILI